MADYKHLYEQMRKMVALYQDEVVPGMRKTIAELERQQKWIPVTERMPEKEGSYLVCNERRSVFITHYYAPVPGVPYRREGAFSHKGAPRVTHWMERPQPPKADYKEALNRMGEKVHGGNDNE